MATTTQHSKISDEGTLSIPEGILAEIGAKPGDTVMLSVDDHRVVRIRRVMSVAELAGSIPPPRGPVDDDFGNVIRESQEEWAEIKMNRSGLKA